MNWFGTSCFSAALGRSQSCPIMVFSLFPQIFLKHSLLSTVPPEFFAIYILPHFPGCHFSCGKSMAMPDCPEMTIRDLFVHSPGDFTNSHNKIRKSFFSYSSVTNSLSVQQGDFCSVLFLESKPVGREQDSPQLVLLLIFSPGYYIENYQGCRVIGRKLLVELSSQWPFTSFLSTSLLGTKPPSLKACFSAPQHCY